MSTAAGAGAAEQPALAEGRAQGAGGGEVLLRLDAFGEHERAGPLGVGVDGVHDLRDRRAGTLLHEPQVELDDVGGEQREEGQRHRVGADVVDGNSPADAPNALDGAQQLGRAGGQGALGDLHDDAQVAGRALGDGEQVVQRCAVEHLRLDVDEDGQRGEQALLDRAAEGRGAAELVELGQPARRAGRREQEVGALERALGAAGQRLVGDDPTGVELDDGLEDAADRAGGECLVQRGRVLENIHACTSAGGRAGSTPAGPLLSPKGETGHAGRVMRTTAVTAAPRPTSWAAARRSRSTTCASRTVLTG